MVHRDVCRFVGYWYGDELYGSFAASLVSPPSLRCDCRFIDPALPHRWAYFIAVGFAAIFLPIITTLYGILCFVPNTQDIARMLGAALVPGRPHANMYFTMYGYNSTEQGRSMVRDLKIGQYTKCPPRVTFTMQCLGAVIGGEWFDLGVVSLVFDGFFFSF